MRTSNKFLVVTVAGLLSMLCGMAQADGLADLKAALVRLQGHAPLKASIEAKTWSRQGEGKEQEETNGLANVAIDDGARGLQVLYSKEMLSPAEIH